MKKGDLVLTKQPYSDIECGIVVREHWRGDKNLVCVCLVGGETVKIFYKHELEVLNEGG